MQEVVPSVHLVATPNLERAALSEFLDSQSARNWAHERFGPSDDNAVTEAGSSDGETLVESMGRLCYKSWAPGLNPNVRSVRASQEAYLANLIRSGHGSVLEHAHYSFVFANVSRVFTHELVRHRHENISQESFRFVRLTDLPFWFPEWSRDDQELVARAQEALDVLQELQLWMADHLGLDDPSADFRHKKAMTSFMRRFAPMGVATNIGWTVNVRGLRHVIEVRTSRDAEEEIRLVFDEVAQIMLQVTPSLFRDATRSEDGVWSFDSSKV